MRKLLFIFCIMICGLFVNLNAQIQDLSSIADGDLVHSEILYDSDSDLFGYIFFYNQGEVENNQTQYEYVLLDKNLNKASNGVFLEKRFKKVWSEFVDCTYLGDNILLTKYYYDKDGVKLLYYSRMISLKDKTASEEFIYDNGEFKNLDADFNKMRRTYKYSSTDLILGLNHNDFNAFVVLHSMKFEKNTYNRINVFDINKNLLWEYRLDNYLDDKIRVVNIKDDLIILGESKFSKNRITGYKLIGFNLQTGDKKFEYVLEDDKSQYDHSLFSRKYGDKIYLSGYYSLYKHRFDWKKRLGFYRIVLDLEGNELSKEYIPWNDAISEFEIDKYGKLKNGYYLNIKNVFFFKDGHISFLTEKFRESKNPASFVPIVNLFTHQYSRSTDFVLFNFTPDFKLKEKFIIEKDLTKYFHNDYLFSQYIKDDEGVVFFFKDNQKDDETKDKNWVLGINTIINGNYESELVPMSSDDFFIYPMPAKEGYILLREFNEKSKYNQLRLEKLNY